MSRAMLRVVNRRRFAVGDSVQMPDGRTGEISEVSGEMLYTVKPYGDTKTVSAHDLELLPDSTGPLACQPAPRPVSAVIAAYSGIERRAA